MSYTLEQKREALAKGELWWRRPLSQLLGEWEKFPYYSASPHINDPRAKYHIGQTPTPPRVLSELEGELLEALKTLIDAHPIPSSVCSDRPAYEQARAAIQKAESTP